MNVIELNIRQAKIMEEILKAKAPISLRDAAERKQITACEKTLRSDFWKIQEFSQKHGVTLAIHRGRVSVSAPPADLAELTAASRALYRDSGIAYTQNSAGIASCWTASPATPSPHWTPGACA